MRRHAHRQQHRALGAFALAISIRALHGSLVSGDHDLAGELKLAASATSSAAAGLRAHRPHHIVIEAEYCRHRALPAGTASCMACARKRTSATASAKSSAPRHQGGVFAQAMPCDHRRRRIRSPPSRHDERAMPAVSITGCVLTVRLSSSAGPSLDQLPHILAERVRKLRQMSRARRAAARRTASCRPTASPGPEIRMRFSRVACPSDYQRSNTAPQVNPPPTPSSSSVWPGRMRPSRTASSSASGIDAAEVLP